MAQEELSALFSRNLTLEPVPALSTVKIPNEEPKIVYISAHYTHTAHVAHQAVAPVAPSPRPASEPPQSVHAEVEQFLKYHGVNTSALSSAQLQLFKTVDEPQKVLLLELWKTCPPTNSSDNPTLAWSMTTVDQEVTFANLRYEQKQEQEAQAQLQAEAEAAAAAQFSDAETIMSLDGTPLTPVQSNEGHWIQTLPTNYMEPYMMSGYEDMARREYEESARKAHAESVAAAEHPHHPKDVMLSLSGAHVIVSSRPGFSNPAHADPVYQNQNINRGSPLTVADWRKDQQSRLQQSRQQQEVVMAD